MKKITLILLATLLLQGCSFSDKKQYKEKAGQYESYYKSILNNDKFESTSPYFAIKADIAKIDGGYAYEIIVDDAKVAMYDVKIMVVENQKDYNDEERMMPSAGIFDEQVYNVIPNQSRVEKGYMSGFQLLGEIDQPEVNLEILVVFNDYRKLNTYREFIEFNLYANAKKGEEIKNEEIDEETETTDDDAEDEASDSEE